MCFNPYYFFMNSNCAGFLWACPPEFTFAVMTMKGTNSLLHWVMSRRMACGHILADELVNEN